jgi:hypothetical protein
MSSMFSVMAEMASEPDHECDTTERAADNRRADD